LCMHPQIVGALLAPRTDTLPSLETSHLRLGRSRWLGGASPLFLIKIINVLGQQGWYYHQLERLGAGLEADLRKGVLGSFFRYLLAEYRSAWAVWRARRAAS
jgi:hypothetical protein